MGQGLAGRDGDSYGYVETVDEGTVADVKMSTVTEYFDDVAANEDLSQLRTYEVRCISNITAVHTPHGPA